MAPIAIPTYRERVAAPGSPGTPVVRSPQLSGFQDIEGGVKAATGTVEKIFDDQAETEALKAAAQTRMDIMTAYRDAQDKAPSGADNFTPNFMKFYGEHVTKVADSLSSPVAQRKYQDKMVSFEVGMQEQALGWESTQRRISRKRNVDQSIEDSANSVFTSDPNSRDMSFQISSNEIKNTIDSVDLPPDAKAELLDKQKRTLSEYAARADIRDRPEQVQDWAMHLSGNGYYSQLRQENTGAGYYAMLKTQESGGRNVQSETSTAFGPYQFTKGTWKDLIARHPDLGLTEKDRYDSAAQEQAIRAFTADNTDILKKAGFPATNVNLYMMHLLGEGGGIRFLNGVKDNKDAPAKDFVDRAAIDANGSLFLQGRAVKDVYAIFAKKFGVTQDTQQKAVGAPSYYADLSPDQRYQLYNQAEAEMRRKRTEGSAAFKQLTDNIVAQYATNGFSTDTVGAQQFFAAYGAGRGSVEYGNFKAETIAAAASHDLQTLNLAEHAQYLESIKPDESDPFYADKLKGYAQARQLSLKVQNAIKEDAAGYITSYNPKLAEALQSIGDVENTTPEARDKAVKNYLSTLGQEYDRLGVPLGQRRTVPKTYADRIAGILDQKLQSDAGARAAVGLVNQYAKMWGKAWPNVYADMNDSMSPLVKVISSGIKPNAALALASVQKQSFGELARTLKDDLTKVDITEKTLDAFQPFITSVNFQVSSVPNVVNFIEQAKKLSAVYVLQGMSTSDATEKAYDDLVGSKYRMVNDSHLNIRIPKPYDKEDVEAILNSEGEDIINKGDVQVGTQIPGAPVTPDKQLERTRNWLGRNAKWVSLPDDSGVGLMITDSTGRSMLWPDSKGQPITRSWQQLDEIRERAAFKRGGEPKTFFGWSFE